MDLAIIPLSSLHYNMAHNGHLYDVSMILMGNLHAMAHSDRGTLSPSNVAFFEIW